IPDASGRAEPPRRPTRFGRRPPAGAAAGIRRPRRRFGQCGVKQKPARDGGPHLHQCLYAPSFNPSRVELHLERTLSAKPPRAFFLWFPPDPATSGALSPITAEK